MGQCLSKSGGDEEVTLDLPKPSSKSIAEEVEKRRKRKAQPKIKHRPLPVAVKEDFDLLRTLGAGTFGRVMLAKHKETQTFYALKVLEKDRVVQLGQVQQTINEKSILAICNHPFLIKLFYAFKDNTYCYMGLEYVQGGDLYGLLKRMGRFSEKQSQFYTANIALALEYLHHNRIVYRDLKPGNLLVDREGYVKIADFGFAKILKGKTRTLCGTPDYLAPEIIHGKGYGRAVDWWALGIIIYEMMTGKPPFQGVDTIRTYEKINECKFRWPTRFNEDLKDLIYNLCQKDVSMRFGQEKDGDYDINLHSWIKVLSLTDLYQKKLESPWKPYIADDVDTSHFEDIGEEDMDVRDELEYEEEFIDF